MENQNPVTPASGRGMAVAGFIISLVSFVLLFVVMLFSFAMIMLGGGQAMAIFWLLLSITGTVLSFIGMRRLKRAAQPRGLGIAGFVIGLIATLLSLVTWFSVRVVENENEVLEEMTKEMMEHTADTAKLRESLNEIMKAIPADPSDTTAH